MTQLKAQIIGFYADLTPYKIIVTTLVLWFMWLVGTVVYRLYFHPLAKFPGRKLAALSSFYEFYFDWWKHGQYTAEIRKMHEQYGMQYAQDSRVTRLTYVGPIVRINPYELHVNDPAFIDQVYASGASGKKRDKDVLSCARSG